MKSCSWWYHNIIGNIRILKWRYWGTVYHLRPSFLWIFPYIGHWSSPVSKGQTQSVFGSPSQSSGNVLEVQPRATRWIQWWPWNTVEPPIVAWLSAAFQEYTRHGKSFDQCLISITGSTWISKTTGRMFLKPAEQLTVSPCVPLKRSSEILTRHGIHHRWKYVLPGCGFIRFLPPCRRDFFPGVQTFVLSKGRSKWVREIFSDEMNVIQLYSDIIETQ